MGMARQLSPGLLGREIAAIYHTGIAVYNREFFYGGGIQEASEPNPMWTSQPGMQHQIMELGHRCLPIPLQPSHAARWFRRDFQNTD